MWRLVSNNWYSVIVNGRAKGFHSTRGLKLGDPLSPTLFIIATELLSRGLNKLNEDDEFRGYGLPKWNPKINHLAYANDTILFCLGKSGYVIKMIKVLRDYEDISGQKVNNGKVPFICMIMLLRWWLSDLEDSLTSGKVIFLLFILVI